MPEQNERANPSLDDLVINVNTAKEQTIHHGEHWGGSYRPLTKTRAFGGARLGVNQCTLPPGRATVPFHFHQREDEAFFVLHGRGVLRYGEELREVGPGDCISCPAGTQTGHQLANPFEDELVYLAIGNHDPEEVCVYPDTGKVMVRPLQRVGYLSDTEYFAAEDDVPATLARWNEGEDATLDVTPAKLKGPE